MWAAKMVSDTRHWALGAHTPPPPKRSADQRVTREHPHCTRSLLCFTVCADDATSFSACTALDRGTVCGPAAYGGHV